MVTGTLTIDGQVTKVTGRLSGTALTLTAEGETLRGTVTGGRIDGPLAATRAKP